MRCDHPVIRETGAFVRAAAAAAASVFFATGKVAALGAILALAMVPRFAACAVVGMTAGWLAARAAGCSRERMAGGDWLRGALLTALAVAWISGYWMWGAEKWCAASAVAGVAGCLVSAAAEYLLGRIAALPALSAGFVAAAAVLWMIFGCDQLACPGIARESMIVPEPAWIPCLLASFAKSLGAVFFLPHILPGICIAVAIGIRSPLALAAALAGWAGGLAGDMGMHALSPWLPAAGNFTYNSTLAGLAISACFFIPSWRAFLLAFAAGALAIVIWHGMAATYSFGSPLRLLPAPFLLATWTILAAMRLRTSHAGIIPSPDLSLRPEEALRARRERLLRDPDSELPALRMPFDGERLVTQGPDGPHTHRGPWRHAIDFEIRDASGGAAPPMASSLDDYYTYRSPVLSPVSGWVVRVEDEVDDNPPGHHNLEQNWGNHIILRTESGQHVLLAHFMRHGIAVGPGQFVAAGAFVGSCGNSGRSPLPHIHLHCQNSSLTGSATLPFRLLPWIEHLAAERRWHASGLPAADTRVSPFLPDPWAARLFQSWRAGRARYLIEPPAGNSYHVSLDIRFTEDGRWHFSVPEETAACFGSVESGTLCMRGCKSRKEGLLSWMALALARVPFTRDTAMNWSETLPSPHPPGWLSSAFHLASATTRSRVVALRGGPDRLESITLSVAWTDGRATGTIEAELSLFRGLTRLTASAPGGIWRISRDDPAQPATNPPS